MADVSTAYRSRADDVISALASDERQGLTDDEARARLERFGRNELAAEKPVPVWRRFLAQFQDVLVILLLNYAWVLRSDAAFEEASAELAEKVARVRKGPQPTAPGAKALATPFRLSLEGRAAAPVLREALLAGAAAVRSGVPDAEAVRAAMLAVLASEPRATADYVSVADPETLAELEAVDGRALLSLAALIDGVRLIDNERVG